MKFKTILLFCLVFSNQVSNQMVNAKSKYISKFQEVNLQTDFIVTHKIRKANLLGLAADQLVVFGENAENERILVIYELLKEEKIYSEVSRIAIPESYLAFDLLKTNTKDKLIFQLNDSLMEYLAMENKFSLFAKSQSIYRQEKATYLIDKDFIDDFNGDGLDDISIVDFDGIHFFMQTASGSFERQIIGIKPQMESREQVSLYSETKIFFGDINLDKKNDLVLVVDNGLDVYLQQVSGLFAEEAKRIDLPIDVKALDWRQIRQSNGESLDQTKIDHRTLFKITDINNDSISDLIVLYEQTEGVLDRKNSYEIYLGKEAKNIVTFSDKPSSVIQLNGAVANFKLLDLDGDKRLEIIIASLDIGISKIIGALVSGSIEQDIYFFKMDGKDVFSESPIIEKDVDVNFSLSSGKSDDPVVLFADFDGDGLQDMILSDGEKTLDIFSGSKNKKLFDKKVKEQKVLLPKDGSLVDTMDLNTDGKQDIVIRYAKQDGISLQSQIVILFAN